MTIRGTSSMTRTIRQIVLASATGALALVLTAYPAQAMRPDPAVESQPATTAATYSTPAPELGLQAGQVTAGTGVGLLLGAGVTWAALRARRPRAATA